MDVSYFSLVALFLCTPIIATPVIQDTEEYALLIGGWTGNFSPVSVEVWFPGATSPCTAPPTIPDLPQAVNAFSAAILGNMIIYCGGEGDVLGDVLNQCYRYTVGSSGVSWDPAPSMIHGRDFFTLTGLSDVIIATGGSGSGSDFVLSSVEVYKDGEWSEVVDWELTTARIQHCAVKYGDSKLVLTGGYTTTINHLTLVEELDTTTGEWTQMPSMNYGRRGHSCVSFENNIIVAGGDDGNCGMDTCLDLAERFSSATGNWEVLPRLNTGRWFHSMGVLNGYPTVMGGRDFNSVVASTEYYDGTQWVYGKQLQNNRAYHVAVVLTCD